MTDSSINTIFRTELAAILGETFDKVEGFFLDRGTSLFETLEPISAETASKPVSATCVNLAAQVNHTRYYLDVLTRSLLGEDVKTDWDGSWQVGEVSDAGWAALKADLRGQVDATMAVLNGMETWDGEDHLGGAISIVAHTAYHLGEIRQALCTLNA